MKMNEDLFLVDIWPLKGPRTFLQASKGSSSLFLTLPLPTPGSSFLLFPVACKHLRNGAKVGPKRSGDLLGVMCAELGRRMGQCALIIKTLII